MISGKLSKTQAITLSAFLSALSIVLTRFCAILVPLGGIPSLSLELGGIPVMLGGILLGPLWGGVIGFIADIVGYLINSRGGAYFFGFTLNAILTGVIPGLLFALFKREKVSEKIFPGLTYAALVLSTIFSIIITLFVLNAEKFDNIAATIIVVVVNLLVFVAVYLLTMRKRKEGILYQKILISTLLVELPIYVLLTPLWMNILYGLPYLASLSIRVFRMAISIPLKTLLIGVLLRALRYNEKPKKEEDENG